MESKLQELTDKIFAEGVDKANQEAGKILEETRKEAEEMKKKADKEAADIIAKAKKEADELKKNTESEINLSARQAINSIKQQLTELITTKSAGEEIKKAFGDNEFIKRIIETAIKNWNREDAGSLDVAVLLPEKEEKELNDYFTKKQKSLLDAGLVLKFDESLESGFKIGPKDGSYQISFTEEDFENFFKNYLRPRTTELLYSGK